MEEAGRRYVTMQQPPRGGWFWKTLLILVSLGLFLMIAIMCGGAALMGSAGSRPVLKVVREGSSPKKVLVIPIEGVIGMDNLLTSGSVNPDTVADDLDYALKDDSVAAVLLSVDSPGGTIHASDVIYRKVADFAAKKPVFAHFRSVAASGGYYVSAPARRIFADRTCITGSISVKVESMNVARFLDMLGMEMNVIKSGKMKDILSPYRPMTDEEREVIRGIVDTYYRYFVDVVAEGRKMPKEDVLALADGRIFTAEKASELGLVDEVVMSEDEVYDKLREILKEDLTFVVRQRTDLLSLLRESGLAGSGNSKIDVGELLTLGNRPMFVYLWGE